MPCLPDKGTAEHGWCHPGRQRERDPARQAALAVQRRQLPTRTTIPQKVRCDTSKRSHCSKFPEDHTLPQPHPNTSHPPSPHFPNPVVASGAEQRSVHPRKKPRAGRLGGVYLATAVSTPAPPDLVPPPACPFRDPRRTAYQYPISPGMESSRPPKASAFGSVPGTQAWASGKSRGADDTSRSRGYNSVGAGVGGMRCRNRYPTSKRRVVGTTEKPAPSLPSPSRQPSAAFHYTPYIPPCSSPPRRSPTACRIRSTHPVRHYRMLKNRPPSHRTPNTPLDPTIPRGAAAARQNTTRL